MSAILDERTPSHREAAQGSFFRKLILKFKFRSRRGDVRARTSSEVMLIEALHVAERRNAYKFARNLYIDRAKQHVRVIEYISKDDCFSRNDIHLRERSADMLLHVRAVESGLESAVFDDIAAIVRHCEIFLDDFHDFIDAFELGTREEINLFLERSHRYFMIFGGALPEDGRAIPTKAVEEPPHENALFGLALSGGGIRSASFSIGFLQALSRIGVLPAFDYISAVSGGGYAASWLAAWSYRHKRGVSGVADELHQKPGAESGPLRWVRRYSSYLAPKLEPSLSGDTWALITAYAANWAPILVLISLSILACLTLPVALAETAKSLAYETAPVLPMMAICILGLFVGLLRRLTLFSRVATENPRYPKWLPELVVLGTVFSTVFASVVVGNWENVSYADFLPALFLRDFLSFLSWESPLMGHIFYEVLALYLISIVVALLLSLTVLQKSFDWVRQIAPGGRLRRNPAPIFVIFLGMAASFALCVLFTSLIYSYPKKEEGFSYKAVVAFAPVTIVFILSLCEMFGSLFTIKHQRDIDRAWAARVAGWVISPIFVWTLVCIIALWGQTLINFIFKSEFHFGGFVLTLVAFGLVCALLKIKAWWFFGAMGLVAYCLVLHCFYVSVFERIPTKYNVLEFYWLQWAIAAGAAVVVAWLVNVNRFSLHGMYKEGLVRTFLGASRLSFRNVNISRPADVNSGEDGQFMQRAPDPVADIDENDDPALAWLARPDRDAPIVLLNSALNGRSETDLDGRVPRQWPFTFSSLFSGSAVSGVGYSKTTHIYSLGKGKGITLGTAMAVSGAAVSPTSGKSTKTLRAMLFGILNARLGLWLGNPSHQDAVRHETPRLAGYTIIREILGLRSKLDKWIHLSDGGHFENLGLFELLRRGCARIVVVDASCDPNGSYTDFANAVRRARIDLGIIISKQLYPPSIQTIRRSQAAEREKASEKHEAWEWYEVNYGDKIPRGRLLYIKPSVENKADLPVEIRQYMKKSPSFPHESTADQFFTEAQMEAYRGLGYENGMTALKLISREDIDPKRSDFKFMFRMFLRVFPKAAAD